MRRKKKTLMASHFPQRWLRMAPWLALIAVPFSVQSHVPRCDLIPPPPLRSRSPGHTSLSISIKRRLPRFRCPNGNDDVILNKPFFLAVWTFYQRSSYSAVNLTTEYSTVRELMQRNLIWQHAYLLAYLLGLLGVSLSKIPISGSCKGHSGEPPMLNKWR